MANEQDNLLGMDTEDVASFLKMMGAEDGEYAMSLITQAVLPSGVGSGTIADKANNLLAFMKGVAPRD